jgi:hypothetical protein
MGKHPRLSDSMTVYDSAGKSDNGSDLRFWKSLQAVRMAGIDDFYANGHIV